MPAKLHRRLLRMYGHLPGFVKVGIIRMIAPTFTSGAAVAIERPDGRVLLVSQSYTTDWCLPGGLVGRAEQPWQSAQREMAEELGITLDLTDRHPLAVRCSDRKHFTLVFRTQVDDAMADAIGPSSPEITATGWFDPAGLPPLLEDTDRFLVAVGFPVAD